ncbi:hypothetical protein LCGC14_0258830 [marine sediment metagenome]|uniref:Uncharacterized protein n=1 Tax=marine sediment metagenome TaxID=412755 RepID=A0A0F9X777_9ZZZZ
MIPLPEKIEITANVAPDNLNDGARAKYDSGEQTGVFEPKDLSTAARVKYDAYYAERIRRRDPSQPGVAQEALDCLAELKADNRSTEELHRLGYSYRSTLKPAQNEEKRIQRDLGRMLSKDVQENPAVALKVADVKGKIADFVEFVPKAVEPAPMAE